MCPPFKSKMYDSLFASMVLLVPVILYPTKVSGSFPNACVASEPLHPMYTPVLEPRRDWGSTPEIEIS